ncbi:MAG: 16S rRNA (uracil(1498)-N(3))-methyltransferase [Treponema sp.]|nr:16S rRNA (uracil(1498)-N(3))-methyltransferase [Treponema sp.]
MRQLIVNKNPDKKGLVIIEGKDFHYLRQVLRVKAGDMVNLRLSDGTLQNSTVCKIDDSSQRITLQVCGALRPFEGLRTTEPQGPRVVGGASTGVGGANSVVPEALEGASVDFTLFQFIPKPQKLELIVRQATECGVKNIIPVISEYAQKGNVQALMGPKLERLDRIVREARQQSGSPVETKVFEPVTVEQAVELWNKMKEEAGGEENAVGFVLSERAVDNGGRAVPEALEGPQVVCIFCGNEGGISPDELELLTKKALLRPLHFSVNILRCETAALYGIAVVQSAILGI